MIREIVARLKPSFFNKLVSTRKAVTAPMRVWFDPDQNTERHREMAKNACIIGETVDLSKTGVAFLVPMIRVKEKYLVGQQRRLNIEIDLPNGKVQLRLKGRRYEKVGMHISTERFLVGAEIDSFMPGSEEAYNHFLKHGGRAGKGVAELGLGID